jgi:hypothetical protein
MTSRTGVAARDTTPDGALVPIVEVVTVEVAAPQQLVLAIGTRAQPERAIVPSPIMKVM